MPNKGKITAMNLKLRFKPDKSGMLVGQCKEFPFIIVKGRSTDSMADQAFKHLEIYMNNFPEEAKRILTTYGKEVVAKYKNKIIVVKKCETFFNEYC